LYNEYQFTASFAVAALMSLFALVTIGVKQWVEWRQKRRSYDDLTEQN
jgi:sulfate/thiosulfate transport system permease protein